MPRCHRLSRGGGRKGAPAAVREMEIALGLFDKLLAGSVAALVGTKLVQSIREDARRRNTPPHFDERVSEREFARIADKIGKAIPRVTGITTVGMTIDLEVRSNSGLSSWNARVDFNDYGRLTGQCWLRSDNSQSPIPEFFAKAVQKELRKHGI